ncbi:uncharacterized protein LACBIDRAFT_235655 [Laccaria bicolor S238N-H82]|uniref:Predicted protein n=1 Tax=Laccaria bicolor (strain S238N-H82 / ATCC MYA-4686) TaxID=486041 RepID=B0DCI0_LACBS|nr:uncharacterized protein LACBIDRAFT_235655 [Laccaria bicolor S238N-H82]EDR07733.1 predicted protein [Laccaria bicolor S238N-H82]|eukprot:XP_001881522.1 predicted protein [Laccaria bicolor S238N-H82]
MPPRRPMSALRRKRLLFSYAPDWAAFFALDKVHGYRRVFSLEDTSYVYPYSLLPQRHSQLLLQDVALYMICFVAPLVIQPLINLLTIRSWWDLHNVILGLALTGAVTQFTKITVGRPRPGTSISSFPYIIARCLPPQNATDPIFGLSTDAICTNTDVAIMRDGFRSFPSGHSSLSFAGLGFLSFYLAGKLHLFDKRGHAGKAWLSLTPFAGAALVAISRTMDYRHHWHDVLVGSILGTVLAYFSYRQYYPSLSSELSHRPYSPRIKDELDANLHRNDLESPVPMANQQQGPAAHRRQESAVQQQQPLTATAQEEDYELEGTAPRPSGPGHLYDVWSEGRKDEV